MQGNRRLSGGSCSSDHSSVTGAKDSPRKGAKTARTHQRTPSFKSQSDLGPFSARSCAKSDGKPETDESPACKLVSALCGKAEKLLHEVKVATEQKASTPSSANFTPLGSPKPSKDSVDELWELKMRLNKVELELDKRKTCDLTETQQFLPEDVHALKAQLLETRSNLSEAQVQLRDAQEQIRSLEKKFTARTDGSSTGGCISPASTSSCGSFTPVPYVCSGCSGGTSTPPQHSPCMTSRSAKALTHHSFGSILETSPRVTATLVPVHRRTSTRSSVGHPVKPTISNKSLFQPILASVRAREQHWQKLAQQHQRRC